MPTINEVMKAEGVPYTAIQEGLSLNPSEARRVRCGQVSLRRLPRVLRWLDGEGITLTEKQSAALLSEMAKVSTGEDVVAMLADMVAP